MNIFDIYCDGARLYTVCAEDGIEALREYFATKNSIAIADEYCARARNEDGVAVVKVSHYEYAASPRDRIVAKVSSTPTSGRHGHGGPGSRHTHKLDASGRPVDVYSGQPLDL